MIRFRLPSITLLRLVASLAFTTAAGSSLRATTEGEPGPGESAPAKEATAKEAASPAVEIHSLLKLGASLTERGEFDSAEIAYRQALRAPDATPADTKDALFGLAHMHRKQGALTKAAAIYEKYLKEFPGDDRNPDALLELGRILRSMGANRLAITRFYSVINSTLKLPAEGFSHYQQLAKTAQFEIAETHFQAGEFAEAAKFYSRLRLLDLAPVDRARAQFKAAYALSLQGQHEAAVTMLHAYLEQWPKDENVPEARYLLATSLRKLDRTQEALAVTLDLLRDEQVRTGDDAKRWAYWQRRTGNQLANDFFEHGDILNAHAIYAGLITLSDEPRWKLPVLYQVALCDERLGNSERAIRAYQDIVDGVKKSPSTDLAELGRMAAWRLGQLDWNTAIRRQVTTMFETTTGRTPPPPPKVEAQL